MNEVLTMLTRPTSIGHLGAFDAEPHSTSGVGPND
jgi:hypothetical protein